MITERIYDILRHASDNGRYVTDEQFVIDLAAQGLMKDYGPQKLADGMHYLTVTSKGREALNEYQAAQPKPVMKKRRISRAFSAWEDHKDAGYSFGFSEFLKQVWPLIKYQP